jgi:hypothetical protein
MNPDSKPGAATPHSLYKLYKSQGAIMANPCTLRQQFGGGLYNQNSATSPLLRNGTSLGGIQLDVSSLLSQKRSQSDYPPRNQFKVIQARGPVSRSIAPVTLSLTSLSMNRTH